MKPLVIYIKDKDIKLTKEELEKYLKEAYDAGHSDGYSEGYASGKASQWIPSNVPDINIPHITWDTTAPKYEPYKITCEASNAIGD